MEAPAEIITEKIDYRNSLAYDRASTLQIRLWRVSVKKLFFFSAFAIILVLSACGRTASSTSEKAVATPRLEAIYDEVVPGMTATQATTIIQRYAPNAPIKRFEQMGYDILTIEWGTTDTNRVSTMTRLIIVFQPNAVPQNNTVIEVSLEQESTAKNYTGRTNRIKSLRAAQH